MTHKQPAHPIAADAQRIRPLVARHATTKISHDQRRSSDHASHWVGSSDKSQAFWAERWGLTRYLPCLHDMALLLAQIGGRV